MRLSGEWLSRAGEGTGATLAELLEGETRGDAEKNTIFVMSTLEQKRYQLIFGDEIHGWSTGFQTPQPCLQPVSTPCCVPEGNICMEDHQGRGALCYQ